MTQYPYAAPEAYPSTPAHREYLERYNTRVVPRAVPSLDLILDVERRGDSAVVTDIITMSAKLTRIAKRTFNQ